MTPSTIPFPAVLVDRHRCPHIGAFLVLASLSLCPPSAFAETKPEPRPLKAPDRGFEEIGVRDVTLSGGFWGPRLEAHQQTTIPHVLNKLEERHHIDSVFGHGKRYDVDGHQEVELALVKLYRATGEKRYLDLCRFLLEERGHVHGTERKPFTEIVPRGDPEKLPGEEIQDWRRRKWSMRNGRMQDHKPVLQQTEAVGHAVRAGYMYAAMADLARFSDAPEYAAAARTLWEDVVSKKMYLTGGLGTAQDGDEGFGDPYLLPNKTYCESCASIAHVLWQHRMNLLDGEAKYADVMAGNRPFQNVPSTRCQTDIHPSPRPARRVTVIQTTGVDEAGKPVRLSAIPYFAWANRGKSPMNLWMHETKD